MDNSDLRVWLLHEAPLSRGRPLKRATLKAILLDIYLMVYLHLG